jgi:hypothetical protein
LVRAAPSGSPGSLIRRIEGAGSLAPAPGIDPMNDRDYCRECGLDLAEDPGGSSHHASEGLCWWCWDHQWTPRDHLREWAEGFVRDCGCGDREAITSTLQVLYDVDWPHDSTMEPTEIGGIADWALATFYGRPRLAISSLREFTETDEPAAGALLGTDEANLIPEGGDVMIYGDGGAGKTTLGIDLAYHLGAGRPWLGIPVPRARNVLLIENEGPRALLRRKLDHKRKLWGDDLGDRIHVYEEPWRQFTLATESWRQELALRITALQSDVLLAGPLTRIGMDEAGTLQQVRDFAERIADLRERCGRALTVVLIHHENKAGAVSGAWEGFGDTLLHVKAAGNGHTLVTVQKARWSSEHSQTTMKLAWTTGEGFALEDGERDLLAEIVMLLLDCKWRTAKEIAAPSERDESGANKGGIGAGTDAVKKLLDDHPERFKSCTGEEAKTLGRSPKAILWALTQVPKSVESVTDFPGEGGDTLTHPPPRRGGGVPESVHLPGLGAESDRQDSGVGGTDVDAALDERTGTDHNGRAAARKEQNG